MIPWGSPSSKDVDPRPYKPRSISPKDEQKVWGGVCVESDIKHFQTF